MRNIALFVEDYAHQQIIGTLVQRIATGCDIDVRLNWRNAVGGHGKVTSEFKDYMRDLKRQGTPWPDPDYRCHRRQLQRTERSH